MLLMWMMATRSEASIERAVCTQAFRRYGVQSIKLNGPGARGWPDRMFILDGGRVLFIEFKRPGGKPTPLQIHRHQLLRNFGHEVAVCDNVDDTLELILRKSALAAVRAVSFIPILKVQGKGGNK